MSATDADDDVNGKLLYFLSPEAGCAFAVDERTGRITTSAPLDRERQAAYSFRVFATDLAPASPRNSSAQVHFKWCRLKTKFAAPTEPHHNTQTTHFHSWK